MDSERIDAVAREYLSTHWDEMLADLQRLISIDSAEDLAHADAEAGMPFGPGPARALDAALGIARGMGFQTRNCEGYIGFADWAQPEGRGQQRPQMGIIAHVDTVPAGPGWSFEPLALTRREGYLIGRGVLDDSGPLIVALHALNCLKAAGFVSNCDWRFLFGCNEETAMGDVHYYRQRYADPEFLFTPDAEFPVSYGEKGIYHARIESAPLEGGRIARIEGGVAINAVPGTACATLADGRELSAEGKSAHASTPQEGTNAIDLLITQLLGLGACSPREAEFLGFAQRITGCTDGSGLGIQCEDGDFGALTAIGSMIRLEGNRLVLSIDIRYPTTTNAGELRDAIGRQAAEIGAQLIEGHGETPFLTSPESPYIQALASAYNQVTGEQAKPFTMAGGTYARHFANAASFGLEKPWVKNPSWVGGMHGPDEGVSEALLQEAFCIYVSAIAKLSTL